MENTSKEAIFGGLVVLAGATVLVVESIIRHRTETKRQERLDENWNRMMKTIFDLEPKRDPEIDKTIARFDELTKDFPKN